MASPTPAALQTWRREAQREDKGHAAMPTMWWPPIILALLDALTAAQDDATHWVMVADGMSHDTRCCNHFKGDPNASLCLRCQLEEARAALTAKDEALDDRDERLHTYKHELLAVQGQMLDAVDESARLTAQVEALQREILDRTETCKGHKLQADRDRDKARGQRDAAEAQVTRLTAAIGKAEAQLVQPWDQNCWITAARDILRAALAPATPPEGPTPTGADKP